MSLPDPAALDAALAATWPAEATLRAGPFLLRRGSGGGRRTLAATLEAEGFTPEDLARAEAQMRAWGQTPRFRVRATEPALDAALDAAGYAGTDPTLLMAAPAGVLAAIEVPRLAAFDIWPPLAIQTEIWAEGGIGPDRLAVMDRVSGPHTALLGRHDDRPAATAFLAADGPVAMIHAVHVRTAFRRKGLARRLLGHAGRWAVTQGCSHVALAVNADNAAATALYGAIGMVEAGRYAYWAAP
jgi:GNAT superfamily N-acetyltransferase